MSLIKFLQIIEKSPVGKFFESKLHLIGKLNPDRIYVENIRAIYNLPTFAAKFFCEMAVVEGVFKKGIGVECLNSSCERIILSVSSEKQIPQNLNCQNCEMLEMDRFEFDKSELHIITYYQLIG